LVGHQSYGRLMIMKSLNISVEFHQAVAEQIILNNTGITVLRYSTVTHKARLMVLNDTSHNKVIVDNEPVHTDENNEGYFGNVSNRVKQAIFTLVDRGKFKSIQKFNGLVSKIKRRRVQYFVLYLILRI